MDALSRRERVLRAFRTAREAASADPGSAEPGFLRECAGLDDASVEGLAQIVSANVLFQRGAYAEAERRAVDARATLVEFGEEAMAAEAEVVLGNIALERGEYDEAALRYSAAASGFRAPSDLGRVHNNLGLVAWRTRDLYRAEEHYRRALECFGPDVEPKVLGNLRNNLGLVYEDRGQRAEAEREFREAAAVLEGVDNTFLANALSNLGDLLRGRGRLEEASALSERALRLREGLGHTRGVVASRITLAQIALQRSELDRASGELERAIVECRKIGLKKQLADALEIRAEAQERSGDAAGAIRSLREALRFREEVFGQQMSDRVAALQVSFDARQARLMAERAQEENVRLTAAMREVEAASAVRSRFLANMSHELRTPLTGVIGAAELLQARGLAPDTQRLVDIIGSAADALLAMINDVLDFSRIEAGRLELAHEVVDPAELAHEVMALVASGVRSGVDVRVDVEAGVPRGIWSDRNRLRQVLLNLSANAVKFTERGFVELHVSRLDDALVCRVTDTGIGIAPGGRERLFEPFVQADGSDTRRFGGTGLGLAITRRIVDAMGGRIDVSSAEGVGSTFTVVLPLRPARVTQRAPAPATQAVAPYRVLLVEDDEMVRGVLGELLAVCGAHVTAVGSAEEALDAAASDLPALVVMDVQMPRMDGITCARELRARHGATLRILVVSGATAARDEAAARAAGVDGWLSKPVTLRGLRAELERLGVRRVT